MNDLLIDLASSRFGGSVRETSDEFFGKSERLIATGDPVREPGRVDGWETRRRRTPGHEWAILRLGLPGVVRRVILDTTHITGSHPQAASVEAINLPGDPHLVELIRQPDRWRAIVARTPVGPDTRLEAPVDWDRPATHLRLVLFPDGGVARLRVLGEPIPPDRILGNHEADVAAVTSGARAVDCSDAHYGSPNSMLLEDRHRTESGWLTRRRRDGRSDWAVVRLAGAAEISRIMVDTKGFEGNAPEACSIHGTNAPAASSGDLRAVPWTEVVPRTRLGTDHRREFEGLEGRFTHLRLTVHPDGGINRFHAFGLVERGWQEA